MKALLFLFAIIVSVAADAQTPAGKTEVLLVGTFHFANPGLDVAKFANADILSQQRQKEVLELVEKLKRFKPDKIFVEATPAYQARYDSLLSAYKSGTHTLAADEKEQVGFRLAKELSLDKLYCVNYTSISFPIDSVMKVMMDNRQMDMLQYFQGAIQKEQADFNAQLLSKNITQIIADGNTDEVYAKLAGVYYFFLKAGDQKNHAGSFLASEQWRRNIYIYENILKNLNGKESRILVLFGTTHAAMLKEMMKYNEALKIVPVANLLKP